MESNFHHEKEKLLQAQNSDLNSQIQELMKLRENDSLQMQTLKKTINHLTDQMESQNYELKNKMNQIRILSYKNDEMFKENNSLKSQVNELQIQLNKKEQFHIDKYIIQQNQHKHQHVNKTEQNIGDENQIKIENINNNPRKHIDFLKINEQTNIMNQKLQRNQQSTRLIEKFFDEPQIPTRQKSFNLYDYVNLKTVNPNQVLLNHKKKIFNDEQPLSQQNIHQNGTQLARKSVIQPTVIQNRAIKPNSGYLYNQQIQFIRPR